MATLGISDGAADGEGDQSDEGQDGEDDESDARTDLDKLPIGVDLRERLLAGGFGSIQALVSADDDHLTSSAMLEDGELETLRTALDGFLGSQ